IADFMLEQAQTLKVEAVAIPPAPPCSPTAWEEARAAVAGTLAAARQGPPVAQSGQTGWVLVALGNAAYELRHAPSLEAGLVETVRRGGATATTAAIAGALLGAVHGRDAIPWAWRDRVLTCRPIEGLPGVHQPRPADSWPVDLLALADALLARSPTGS